MTQKDVAKKLGYFLDNGEPNRSQIARFENDHAPINKRVELAIRYIFRQDVEMITKALDFFLNLFDFVNQFVIKIKNSTKQKIKR